MQYFARPGDTVLTAASDDMLLSAYAVQRLNGSLTVLVINKDPLNTFTGQIGVNGFTPAPPAIVYSYGIPQDNAAETGSGSPDIATNSFPGAGTSFNYAFPPYSATVLALSPVPKLQLLPQPPSANQLVLEIEGQAGFTYIVQQSTNLTTWTSVSTNTLTASTLYLTNAIPPATPQQFWRVLWQF
jgi:hypothetical protein